MCPPRAKLFICVVAVLVTCRWIVDFDLLSGLERGLGGGVRHRLFLAISSVRHAHRIFLMEAATARMYFDVVLLLLQRIKLGMSFSWLYFQKGRRAQQFRPFWDFISTLSKKLNRCHHRSTATNQHFLTIMYSLAELVWGKLSVLVKGSCELACTS